MITLKLASVARALTLALSLLFVFALPAAADPKFPALDGQRVVDDAHILPADVQAALTQKSADLEARTGDQLVIVTVPSLQGDNIEDFGYKLGRAWGIGQKGKNNGVVFLVAPNDHKARIEVGYGLEDVLTDALSSLILQDQVFPRFRQGDMAGGVTAGTDAIDKQLTLDKPEAVKRAQAATVTTRHAGRHLPIGAIIAMVVIFLVLTRVLRVGFWPLFLLGGLGRGGWGGGGGWSGGGGDEGGGGFGGGGGSFGGGGASGDW